MEMEMKDDERVSEPLDALGRRHDLTKRCNEPTLSTLTGRIKRRALSGKVQQHPSSPAV